MSAPGHLDDLRRALLLTPAEESLLRTAAPQLAPDVPLWVDAFYQRLVTDPSAMAILADEGRVLRLKRSLTAWFHELFALPLDEAYERARAEIGRAHVRIGLPAYLMVTAMSHLRADVRASILRRFAADAGHAERVARSAEKHLDLELALMLGTYARRSRQVDRQRDRALLLERMARRLAARARDTLDAALCYAELMRRAEEEGERSRWAARLEDLLKRLARSDAHGLAALAALDDTPMRVDLAELVAQVLAELPRSAVARVHVRVLPADLSALVLPGPLKQALIEVLGNALRHDAEGRVALSASERPSGGLSVEVVDSGSGWPRGQATVEEVLAATRGLGLAYAELVASLHGGMIDLFHGPEGGAGVRFVLGPGEAL